MKHIVFLVGSYYPNYSAVGKCIANIADCFSSQTDQYRVTVIAWNTEYGEDSQCELHNQHIKRISTTLYKNRLYFQNQFSKTTGIKKKLCHVGLLVCRACNAAKMFLNKTSIDQAWVRAYRAALDQIQEPIDAIIPTCSPFEAIVAAIDYCDKKSIDMFPVLFDQFAANATLHRSRINRHIKMKANLKMEQRMLISSVCAYAMATWKNHLDSEFPEYMSKVFFVEHPLLVQNKNHINTKKTDNINIVYTGAIDAVMRPLSNIASIIERYLEKEPSSTEFSFYIFGNDCAHIDRLQKKYPYSVFNKGNVSEQKSKEAICNASVLLSIGNTNSNQFPSKLFDYISCGLPIVHFYIKDDDPVIAMLKRYPLGICLPQDKIKIEETVEQFTGFLIDNSGKQISFDTAKSLYPEASPDILAENINAHIRRKEQSAK